jgi:group I intron endonuclease
MAVSYPKTSGIYKIINLTDKKIYIGSTINLHKRFIEHFNSLRNNKHHNQKLQRSVNKYSINNFVFETIEECIVNKLQEREQYYMDLLKPYYNILKIARSSRGYRHSPKVVNESRKRAKERWRNFSEEERAKEIRRLGEIRKNNKYTEETRRKMSEGAKKSRCWEKSLPTRKKMMQDGNYKLRDIPIVQFDRKMNFITEYPSIKSAAKVLSADDGTICKCCKGKRKTAYNYIWKYKKDTI